MRPSTEGMSAHQDRVGAVLAIAAPEGLRRDADIRFRQGGGRTAKEVDVPPCATLRVMRSPRALILLLAPLGLFLAGCGTSPSSAPARPEDVRARIVKLLPQNAVDRPGWAIDLYAAFDALRIEPSVDNVCAVLAVTEPMLVISSSSRSSATRFHISMTLL